MRSASKTTGKGIVLNAGVNCWYQTENEVELSDTNLYQANQQW